MNTKTVLPEPEFGPRERLIYRYGILDADKRRRQADQKLPPMPPEHIQEMKDIEKKLEMPPSDIVSADFRYSFKDSVENNIGGN